MASFTVWNQNSTKEAVAVEPFIKIKGTPHRGIENRPRDGAKCDCLFCFGICNVSVEFGWKFWKMSSNNFGLQLPSVNAVTGKIYFEGEHEHSETEFGIDDDFVITGEAAEQFGINSITIKEGLYEYVDEIVTFIHNGQSYTSYGYVEVNVEVD